jgi:hypothetical protein
MNKKDVLINLKGLVYNGKIEAAIDLLLFVFDFNYEDFEILKSQLSDAQTNQQDKNRITTVLIEHINILMQETSNEEKLPIDIQLRINEILKSPYALVTDKKNIGFFVTHHHNSMPYSYDYFFKEGNLEKAYTETDFGLLLNIINPFDDEILLTNISVRTINYEPHQYRILRQHGPKGFIEPTKLTFIPSKNSGESIRLFKNDTLFIVSPFSKEKFLLKLDDCCIDGFYKLMIIVNVLYKDKHITLESEIVPLSIQNSIDENCVFLNIALSHHDSISKNVLQLDAPSWEYLKKESVNDEYLLYLGDTILDHPFRTLDSTWKIKKLKKRNITKNGFEFSSAQKSTVVLNLGVKL